jgi:hypothetical protein
MSELDAVWVFNGANSTFSAGVFQSKSQADEWIAKHKVTGCLTQYPLGIGIYD